ncbi:MAG: hypothetical protein IKV52_04310 [Oscillospiraceae bacterium]|nr:hypothetical protein [Oscillospiraceae bacterium]
MKKFLAVIACMAVALSLTACSAAGDNSTTTDNMEGAEYRTGVGSYTTTQNSSSAVEDENGKGIVSTTLATVVFDSNNIIKKVYIDQVESKVYFDSHGQIVPDGMTSVATKRELGDSYNMKPASGIGKEWYEQIDSLESWLVGKNIKDIANGVMENNMYGNNNDDSVTSRVEGGIGGAVDGIVSGAENLADSIARGAESIMEGTVNGAQNDSTNDESLDGTSTAEGMTDNTQTGSSSMNSTDSNSAMNSGSSYPDDTDGYDALDWESDLRASVTIDLTDIKIALQKAYANAR